MPGAPLNPYPIPDVGDKVNTQLNKITECLQTLKTDLEKKVVPAEIDINNNLDFNGHRIHEIGAAGFGIVSDPGDFDPGFIVYNGEWYMVTPDGPVQITLNGQLNAAGFGGIVGSGYGVSGALVTFNNTDDSYEFTAGTDVWADLIAHDLVMRANAPGTGIVRFTVDPVITTAVTLNWAVTVPPSNTYLLGIDSNGDVKRVTTLDTPFTHSANVTLSSSAQLNLQNGSLILVNGNAGYFAQTFGFGNSINSVWYGPSSVNGVEIVVNSTSANINLVGNAAIHKSGQERYVLPNIGMKTNIDTPSIGSNQTYGVLINAGESIVVPVPVQVGETVDRLFACLATAGGVTPTGTITVAWISATGVATNMFSGTTAVTASLGQKTITLTSHTFATGEALRILLTAPAGGAMSIGPVGIRFST